MRNNLIILGLNVICILIIIQIQFDLFFLNPFDFDSNMIIKINQLLFIFQPDSH